VAERRDAPVATPPAQLGRSADAAAGRVQQRSAAEAPAAATESFLRKAAEILVASPAPEVRWRAGTASIDRTTDGGQTWRSSEAPAGAVIVAGAAPSATTCWLVGRGGLVLLTTDGATWERLRFPEAVDLAAIEAADARTATVTTSDARRFRTTDGGRTWVRDPLQEN
jgi:photosystem II stability/assembly factor-like uncharacterized protein